MDELLDELEEKLKSIISDVNDMKQYSYKMAKAPNQNSWSALKCLHHLNLYGAFYIPVFTKGIAKAAKKTGSDYKPGWFGNRSANSMLPEAGETMNPMKAFKSKNPSHLQTKLTEVDKFLDLQDQFLKLIQAARRVDLSSVRVKTTLPILKFKLGDALRFVIFHEVRHIGQAKRAFTAV